MTKYQASKRVIKGAISVGLFLKSCIAFAGAGPAIGPAFNPLCPAHFMKGSNVIGGMAINGMGGIGDAYPMGSPTLCIREGQLAPQGDMQGKMSPAFKRFSHQQAMQALFNLQDSECKPGKVSPKTQACFLFKTIQQKAQAPITAITTTGNALFLKNKDKVTAMIVVERFGNITPKKKKGPTIEQLVGAPNSTAVFSEFDNLLKRHGSPNPKSVSNKCSECLKMLKASFAGDLECNVCNDTISFDFNNIS
ncbi:hypothetical protein NEMIN01_1228 [Nematocida minor]|uniref:uncharacterized protein n=1 Tax=Nematocida minor TaxID=1912983 RepID=UPI00221EC453|nr:uncharacterized protein NEMIN01_1228 [Nematocida minor]KAI5190826.1 hypothetical protein NEMIN01_1228 [Nematocida minor]